MKTILLAAAALIATPAVAQTTAQPQTGTPATQTPADPATTTQQAPMQNMSTPDDAAPSTTTAPDQGTTSTQPMPAAPPAGTTGGMGGDAPGSTAGGNMSPGGYQPSTPMPAANAGGQPVFTPGPSVAQAFPAPAPLDNYPICKKGQFDKCMQRGGK